MLQVLIRKGRALVEEVPAPKASRGSLLIRVVNSCISPGTELSGIEASAKSLIRRAVEQPGKVIRALDMARKEGLGAAYATIKEKLDAGVPTGYSIAGVVVAAGEGVDRYRVGDRVAAAGAGYANHAEYVDVPVNLVMPLPRDLDFVRASTVTIGGIAMHGVRRANCALGEFVVVVGAGVLGLLSVQMLRLSGARVAVVDLDAGRLEVARALGAEIPIDAIACDPVREVENWSRGNGADAVLFTAAAQGDEPLSQAFRMCRKKGRVVLVGVAGMNLRREDMYPKELEFLMSTSYGPGRYDRQYEEKGVDYPFAYVRWTENRNMEEYLRLLSSGAVALDRLIGAVVPIREAESAFAMLSGPRRPLMVVLDYGDFAAASARDSAAHDRKVAVRPGAGERDRVRVALVGAGQFATAMHLPNLRKLQDRYALRAVVNRTGHKAQAVAAQYGAAYATTEVEDVLRDPDVDLVMVATRHDSHATLALRALSAGKHVFVEKPLATNLDDLQNIRRFFEGAEARPLLMPGFNRRFSPYAREIRRHAAQRVGPLLIRYRMNAGYLPPDHWAHEDGGRIVGEACHIVDLATFLIGGRIAAAGVEELTPADGKYRSADNKVLVLKYEDGSVATIEYFSVGSGELAKECMEVHFDGKSIVMDDFRSLRGYGIAIEEIRTTTSAKGQPEELQALHEHLAGRREGWPIELWDMLQTTETTLRLA